MQKGQLNIYKPSGIKRWGVEQFLSEVAPKDPIQPIFISHRKNNNEWMRCWLKIS